MKVLKAWIGYSLGTSTAILFTSLTASTLTEIFLLILFLFSLWHYHKNEKALKAIAIFIGSYIFILAAISSSVAINQYLHEKPTNIAGYIVFSSMLGAILGLIMTITSLRNKSRQKESPPA